MKDIKLSDKFEILGHNIDEVTYIEEVLLDLDIISTDELSEGIHQRILELHFNEENKEYKYSILYEVPKNMNDDSISTHFELNETMKDKIRRYISQNNLGFIL